MHFGSDSRQVILNRGKELTVSIKIHGREHVAIQHEKSLSEDITDMLLAIAELGLEVVVYVADLVSQAREFPCLGG